MARCTLDLSHPCFLASLGKLQDDPEVQEALKNLKKKIELEHTSCGRVIQQFYGNNKFTYLHGKIWKYDWAKPGAHSSGRKSWRMVVVVPDPNTQPYGLIAGAIYFKSDTEQLPMRELAEIFDCVTKAAFAANVLELAAGATTGEFRRVSNGDGQTRSICALCYTSVAVSIEIPVLDKAEQEHRCNLATSPALYDDGPLKSEPE
jgi:hypothetical protein